MNGFFLAITLLKAMSDFDIYYLCLNGHCIELRLNFFQVASKQVICSEPSRAFIDQKFKVLALNQDLSCLYDL